MKEVILKASQDEVQLILRCMNAALKMEQDAISASQLITPVAIKISSQAQEQTADTKKPEPKKLAKSSEKE